LQDGKAEYETHSIAAKVIFISSLKVHVHVIEDMVLMIVLKSKLKDKTACMIMICMSTGIMMISLYFTHVCVINLKG
jgi:hypothetical protein